MSRTAIFVPCCCLLLVVSCGRSPRGYLEKGNQYFKAGKYDDAALNYRKAIQKDSGFGEALYQLGLTELKRKNLRDAYTALTSASQLLPRRPDVQVALADLVLRVYMADKRRPARYYEQLTELSEQLLARDPNSFDGLRIKGNLAWSEGKLAEAAATFAKANASKPMEPNLVPVWTQVLFLDGRAAEGERLAQEFLQGHKDSGQMYDVLFRYYRSQNRLVDAENVLKSKVNNNPAEIDYALQLAAYYAATGKPVLMTATLRSLSDAKVFPDAFLKVGDFYGARQSWPDALRQYEEGAKANPKQRIVYLKRITDAWLAQGKGEEAAGVIHEILREQPQDENARAVNASLLLKNGKVEESLNTFQDLVKISPDNAVWRFSLGRALVAKGDLDGARVQFQESLKRRPDFMPARLALADVNRLKHDYRETLRYANEALAVDAKLLQARLLRSAGLIGTQQYPAHSAKHAARCVTARFRSSRMSDKPSARPNSRGDAVSGVYWWRVPDDEAALMSLRPAELKCYLVVLRAIQRDKNAGMISERQVSQRAGVTFRHVHGALARLVELGWLCREGKLGATATYSLPHSWNIGNCIPTGNQLEAEPAQNRFPTGNQLNGESDPKGNHHRFPTGDQNRFPTGNQHLEFLESSEPSSSSTEYSGRFLDPGNSDPVATTPPDASRDETQTPRVTVSPRAASIPFPQASKLSPSESEGPRQPHPAEETQTETLQHPWNDEELHQAREAMREHFGARMLPDWELTREVLKHMLGVDDVRLWLLDISKRRVKVKGWGFYQHDAAGWPARRADMQQQTDTQRRVMEAEARATSEANAAASRETEAWIEQFEQERQAKQEFIEAATVLGWQLLRNSNCRSCHGFGRRDIHTGEFCGCESGRKLARELERCHRCDDKGLVEAAEDRRLFAWCGCVHAARRREREPNLVEEANRDVRTLLDQPKPAVRDSARRGVGRGGGLLPAQAANVVRRAIR